MIKVKLHIFLNDPILSEYGHYNIIHILDFKIVIIKYRITNFSHNFAINKFLLTYKMTKIDIFK